MEWNNKTRTRSYLTGRFFDGISSGLFMMALPWAMLSTPNMGAFVAMVALACTAVFCADAVFLDLDRPIFAQTLTGLGAMASGQYRRGGGFGLLGRL